MNHPIRPRDDPNQLAEPQVPDAFGIADEAGRALDTVSLATVLPRPLKK
jgi:hypothetical protein